MMISQEGGDICNYVSIYRVMVNVFYSSMRLKAGINHYVNEYRLLYIEGSGD